MSNNHELDLSSIGLFHHYVDGLSNDLNAFNLILGHDQLEPWHLTQGKVRNQVKSQVKDKIHILFNINTLKTLYVYYCSQIHII